MRASLARAKSSARSDAGAGGRLNSESSGSAKSMGAQLKKAQNLITNRPDKSQSKIKQLSGTAASYAGKTAGGIIGSFVPALGTAIGAAIGSRLGRLAGEHPAEAIVLAAIALLISMLPMLIIIGLLIAIFKAVGVL